ncbi:hypothetical protein [Burkholderia dolosa]|jgi:hypothetical protein|uniref:hypothetical protein n=1 Tax=Burkholderia dolosa TaxID=152500 RepID=UPI0015913F98|nr:hypothetical protein [Burkholderia dolosa]MBY4750519.1 hypothetical protein [Burkholderia dolosa]
MNTDVRATAPGVERDVRGGIDRKQKRKNERDESDRLARVRCARQFFSDRVSSSR